MRNRLSWGDAWARLNALWHLRRATIGRGVGVWGRPVIDAQDLHIGNDVRIFSTLRTTRIAGEGQIRIGARTGINHGATITARERVSIGADVIIGDEVRILDHPGHGMEGRSVAPMPVTVGDGAWIAFRALVMPGVSIGPRSIVAAGSIVTHDVPEGVVVAGSPARILRPLDLPEGSETAWFGT